MDPNKTIKINNTDKINLNNLIKFNRFKKKTLKLLYSILYQTFILYYIKKIKCKKIFETFLKISSLPIETKEYIESELMLETKNKVSIKCGYTMKGEIIQSKKKVLIKVIHFNTAISEIKEVILNTMEKIKKVNNLSHPRIPKFFGTVLVSNIYNNDYEFGLKVY